MSFRSYNLAGKYLKLHICLLLPSFTKCDLSDKMKEDKMGGAYSTHGSGEKFVQKRIH